ncbi:MAG: hypothetical protein II129_03400, partial [Paludibacteraceae bacterium]|nr:hypothetical protein [Paludibacteraceae bacterium]
MFLFDANQREWASKSNVFFWQLPIVIQYRGLLKPTKNRLRYPFGYAGDLKFICMKLSNYFLLRAKSTFTAHATEQ